MGGDQGEDSGSRKEQPELRDILRADLIGWGLE